MKIGPAIYIFRTFVNFFQQRIMTGETSSPRYNAKEAEYPAIYLTTTDTDSGLPVFFGG